VGMGAPCNTILSQADAKVIDFGATAGGKIDNFTVSLTAPTTAINAIQGTTGTFQTNMCQSTLTCTQALEQADQPAIGYVSGAGTLDFNLGKVTYTHSGTTVSGIKAPFKAGAGGEVTCYNVKQIDINGSGSGSVTAPAIVVGTGHVVFKKCDIDVDDDTCTTVAGMGYIGSATSVSTEFIRNTVHVHGNTNDAYGAFALLGSFRSAFNHIHVETAGAGKEYSFVNNGAGTINSHMDDIIATDGYTGTGTINMVSSDSDGNLTVTGVVTIGSLPSRTPVTDSAANFAANFAGDNLYGGTFVCNSTGTCQLPLMVAGMNFTIITLGDIEVVADTNVADGYLMDGTTNAEGKNLTNLSTSGDIAVFQYYTADDWLITTNGWTAEA